MSIVIAYGTVRLELPISNNAELSITLPNSFKGGLNIKQEKEHVITLDCSSVITLKEEAEIVEVEPVVPPVAIANAEPLRIRTPPLPMSPESPVVAYGLSPSPIPFVCPQDSPHDFFETLLESAPELAPPSLVETAPVNPKGKTGRINKKKDRTVSNYVEDGELITHSVSTGGHAAPLHCVSVYQKQINQKNGESYDCFMIQQCESVPSLIGSVYYTLTEVCRTFSNELVKAGLRNAPKNATFNGWDNSRVMRNGKMTKLSKIRDEADETA